MDTDVNIIFEGTIFDVIVKKGRTFTKRKACTGIVKVVPYKDGKIILIGQSRIPVGGKTIEFPAGMAGDNSSNRDETLMEAAKRELLEEAGYVSEDVVKLHQGPISAETSADIITTFAAFNIEKKQEGQDNIEVFEVELEKAHEFLYDMGLKGYLVDDKVYSAIYLLEKHLSLSTTKTKQEVSHD